MTTAARTLLDEAAVLTRHELERAMQQAEALRLSDVVSLAALVERYRRSSAWSSSSTAGRITEAGRRSEGIASATAG